MKKMILVFIPLIILYSSCALEVANVVGPAGGYVFFDNGKGSYDNQTWRYKECSPVNAGSIIRIEEFRRDVDRYDKESAKKEANKILAEFNSNNTGKFNDWVLPDEKELILMLQSFRWELTKFKKDLQYICSEGNVYRNNRDNNTMSDQELLDDPFGIVYVRPIRRF